MKKYRIGEVTENLDNLRKPLNSIQRSSISQKKLYPYYGANNLIDYVDEYIFDEEILCVAEDGGSWGYKEKCTYIVNEKCWVNNHAHVLRAKDNLNISYLSYYLNYNDLNSYITGTTRGKLTKSALSNIEILLPELEKQNTIVEILDKAQELIDKRKEQIKTLDELVKSKFIEMFGDPVLNTKGWNFPLIENVVSNEKNSIKAGPFGSALKKEFYVDSGYKIYGQEQVISGDVNYGDYYISEEKYKELENCAVKANDVLISLVGTYGKLLIIPEKFEAGIINPRLMKITFDTSIVNTIYFKHFFQSDSLRNKLSNNTHGGTMDILNVGIVKKIHIPVPPIELQNKFVDFVKQTDKLKFEMEKSLKELEDNFNSLMQKAFKGELFN